MKDSSDDELTIIGQVHSKEFENLNKLFQQLNEKQPQGFDDDYQFLTIQLQLLEESLDQQELKSVNTGIRQFLKKNRQFNIKQLQRNIQNTEDTSSNVQNRDIVMLFGTSGSSKQTATYFLQGNSHQKQQYQCPDADVSPVLIKLCHKESKYSEIKQNTLLYICDTLGNDNSDFPEMDMANDIQIFRILQQCRSVRPVFLISYCNMGDRGTGFLNYLQLLIDMFDGEIGDYKSLIGYLFTKFPDRTNIKSQMLNIRKCIDQSKQKIIELLVDIIEKFEQNKGINIMDQQNGDPLTMLDNIMKQSAIKNPKDIFKQNISNFQQSLLIQQIDKHHKYLKLAMDKQNYIIASQILDQIYFLKDTIKNVKLEEACNGCIKMIENSIQCINDKYNECCNQISDYLKQGDQKIPIEIGQAYYSVVEQLKSIQKYLNYGTVSLQEINENLNKQIENLEKYIFEDQNFDVGLVNFMMLIGLFNKLEQFNVIYEKVQDRMKYSINKLEIYINQSIDQNNFQGFNQSINKITKYIKQSSEYFNFNLNCDQFIRKFYDKLEVQISNLLVKIKHIVWNQQMQDIEFLNNIYSTLELTDVQTNQQLRDFQSEIEIIIVNYFKEQNDDYDNSSVKYLHEISQRFQKLRSIPKFKQLTQQIYEGYINKIEEKMNMIKQNIIQNIPLQFDIISDQGLFREQFDIFTQFGWMGQVSEKYEIFFKAIKERIRSHFETIKTNLVPKIRSINLSNTYYLGYLDDSNKIINYIQEINIFQIDYPEIDEMVKNLNVEFNQQVKQQIKIIDEISVSTFQNLQSKQLDYEMLEKAYSFMDQCCRIKKLQYCDYNFQSFKSNMIQYLSVKEKEIIGNLNDLQRNILQLDQIETSFDQIETMQIDQIFLSYRGIVDHPRIFSQERVDLFQGRIQSQLNKLLIDWRKKINSQTQTTFIENPICKNINKDNVTDKINGDQYLKVYQEFLKESSIQFQRQYQEFIKLIFVSEQRYLFENEEQYHKLSQTRLNSIEDGQNNVCKQIQLNSGVEQDLQNIEDYLQQYNENSILYLSALKKYIKLYFDGSLELQNELKFKDIIKSFQKPLVLYNQTLDELKYQIKWIRQISKNNLNQFNQNPSEISLDLLFKDLEKIQRVKELELQNIQSNEDKLIELIDQFKKSKIDFQNPILINLGQQILTDIQKIDSVYDYFQDQFEQREQVKNEIIQNRISSSVLQQQSNEIDLLKKTFQQLIDFNNQDIKEYHFQYFNQFLGINDNGEQIEPKNQNVSTIQQNQLDESTKQFIASINYASNLILEKQKATQIDIHRTDLHYRMKLVKSLIQFDKIMDKDNFYCFYIDLSNLSSQQYKQMINDLNNLLVEGKYKVFLEKFIEYNYNEHISQKDKNSLTNKFQTEISVIIEEISCKIMSLKRNYKFQDFNEIIDKIQTLFQLIRDQSLFGEYFQGQLKNDKLKIQQLIKKFINEQMEYIEALFELNKFDEAEQNKVTLEDVLDSLSSQKSIISDESINEIKVKLNQLGENTIAQMIRKYEDMDVCDYILFGNQPKELFQQITNREYVTIRQQLQKIIGKKLDNFKQQLNDSQIEIFQQILQNLPNDIRQNYC